MEKFSIFIKDEVAITSNSMDLKVVLTALASCIADIAKVTRQGAIGGHLGNMDTENIQGEVQKKLDVRSNEIFIDSLSKIDSIIALVSEENEFPILADENREEGHVIFFDPLDGSSNIDVNGIVGSIFSIYKTKRRSENELDLLSSGFEQIAAGYSTYGPSTMLVMTVGNEVNAFTLDENSNEFLLTHPNLRITRESSEYAINSSNYRFWEPPVQKYIKECNEGSEGQREKNFNMRWCGSMVADIHRILMRGGIFLYPKDNKLPQKAGRLRLMYEANPMALLIERAGGLASTGRERILEILPENYHQRTPVIMGAAAEVERIIGYFEKFDSGELEFDSPLFRERSLFVDRK